MREYRIHKIWVDDEIKTHPLVNQIVGEADDVEIEIISSAHGSPFQDISFREGKKSVLLSRFAGNFVKPCPGTGQGYLCCGYTVINQPINCPLDCTYCILQDYLGPSPNILYVNVDELIEQLDEFLQKYRGSFLRIGNGELADSLALDYLSGFSSLFIAYFRKKKNVVFEFKTKTDQVGKILQLPPSRNIVVSWSLNPEGIISQEEYFSASLKRRLEAAHQVQEKGFMLGFHFDPLLLHPGWEINYERVIDNLFTLIDPSRIFWISLGALRFPSSLKEMIEGRFPQTRIIYEEMIRGLDGKLRYIKPLRIKMFRRIHSLIKERAPHVFCYLCMESPDVWERVMGFAPRSNAHFRHMLEEHCRKVLNT